MAEINIKEQIKRLKELQEIDGQIYQHKSELTEKPLALEELRKHFEEKKDHLRGLEAKLKNALVERKSKEVELQTKEGDIAKANAQLSLLKTNKEYQAKITEIEHFKADKSIMEEKILMDFELIDQINADIAKEKDVVAQEEKKYLAQKKEVDDEALVLKDKVKVLEGKRNQILPLMDKTIVARYERVLKNKEGLAFVPVTNDTCAGCFMNIPPQVINEIKMYDRIISCEICSRILYLEEDL